MSSTTDQSPFDTAPYRAGGYIVVRAAAREEWMSTDLLPAHIISASSCICPQFPGSWGYLWSGDGDAYRRWKMEQLGLPAGHLDELVLWLSELYEDDGAVQWPNAFLSLDCAREFIGRFARGSDLTLLGLAIHPRYLAALGQVASRAGFWSAVDVPRALAPGCEPLGFELLGYDGAGSGHSWICNDVERSFYGETGVRPNAAGFLPSQDAADACLAYIHDDYLRAEPVPWFPWLVVQYPEGLE